MPTKSWRKNSPVTDRLEKHPYEFTFSEAIRLIERAVKFDRQNKNKDSSYPLGNLTPPSREPIRFATHQSLAFPSSEIGKISRATNDIDVDRWQLSVNLMGLTGAMGVLPFHYTEMILDRQKQRDDGLAKFFDLFNHRTISLFFEASIKYRLPLQFERLALFPKKSQASDPQTYALLSLIGLGTGGLSNRLQTRDESLIYYGGLFGQKVRTESGLRQILRSYFNIPVEIGQFVGQWQDLIDDVRTKLPEFTNPSGRNARLGHSALLGRKGWFAQGKIYIVLGPLNKQQLERFSPGTSALKALDELVRLYVGMECDFEFKIRIRRRDIPEKIRLSRAQPPILAWNAWLSYGKLENVNLDETVDISISARRLR